VDILQRLEALERRQEEEYRQVLDDLARQREGTEASFAAVGTQLNGLREQMTQDYAQVMGALATQRDHLQAGLSFVRDQLEGLRHQMAEDNGAVMKALAIQRDYSVEHARGLRQALGVLDKRLTALEPRTPPAA
jgi:uncharacterized protein involved in exopolysaccharide biosynthesis